MTRGGHRTRRYYHDQGRAQGQGQEGTRAGPRGHKERTKRAQGKAQGEAEEGHKGTAGKGIRGGHKGKA